MANTLPRQSVSFYWSLGLHCVEKWIPPSRDPACHSSNNKSNKHGKRPVIFFFLHFWMQTLWFRIFSLHQSCGTHSGCMKCYCMIQTTHFWQSMKGYCFFVLPLLHCLSFCVFFFSLSCLDCFQTGTRQRGVRKMALHCSTWCSWDCSLELVYSPIKEGDTVAMFVLQE